MPSPFVSYEHIKSFYEINKADKYQRNKFTLNSWNFIYLLFFSPSPMLRQRSDGNMMRKYAARRLLCVKDCLPFCWRCRFSEKKKTVELCIHNMRLGSINFSWNYLARGAMYDFNCMITHFLRDVDFIKAIFIVSTFHDETLIFLKRF